MSSRAPTTVSFSLEEFSKHGGITGPHKDGWGIAYYGEKDVQLFKEIKAAGHSAFARFIKENNFISKQVISHIRLATQGSPILKNTHPFAREMEGHMHVFAHNGDLSGIIEDETLTLGRFKPVGDTDSEYAFCYLLSLMEEAWSAQQPPSLDERYSIVSHFAEKIRPFGPANFLYADGDAIFAHGHQRTQPGREGRHPPGLYRLCRTCSMQVEHAQVNNLHIDGLALGFEDDQQAVVLVASVPLTTEHWIPFEEGQLFALRDGIVVKGRRT